uniref:PDZ domain-containing protein n=1 Tax=Guillardia theta TaxID=55529 RepID=A0A7S4P089_GUITH|mmetsp:Transcript_40461/g.127394  ORF Transcript_40461/g.127394 Transcript_40461/m.127394 type:complete len:179 (+) Transcript_40461:606-1142(+)
MESPQTPMGGASMWSCQASPPTSGTRMCGIGCSINVNDWGELIIRKVVAGGPAAFSCEIACDDILLQVDGVSVVGETPEEVAKRIVGPEGMPITLMIRFRSFLEGRETWVEKVVALIRQPTVDSLPCSLALFLTPSDQVHMPERLSEGRVGVGVEVVSDERRLEVKRLQPGGPSATSG